MFYCLWQGRITDFSISDFNCIYSAFTLLYVLYCLCLCLCYISYVLNIMSSFQCFILVLTYKLIKFSELIWEYMIHLLVNITI